MTNKHTKIYSTSLAIREIQIKITIKWHQHHGGVRGSFYLSPLNYNQEDIHWPVEDSLRSTTRGLGDPGSYTSKNGWTGPLGSNGTRGAAPSPTQGGSNPGHRSSHSSPHDCEWKWEQPSPMHPRCSSGLWPNMCKCPWQWGSNRWHPHACMHAWTPEGQYSSRVVASPHNGQWSGGRDSYPTHTTVSTRGGSTQPPSRATPDTNSISRGASCTSPDPWALTSDSDTHKPNTTGSDASNTPRQLGNSGTGDARNNSIQAHGEIMEEHKTQVTRAKATKATPK